jgi:phosphoribosylformimino-5-aminoimidazole carboxamide ribonucleotide (ProFAR) isomerase
MLKGPDMGRLRSVAGEVEGTFLYSGGIGSLDHLRALRELALPNLEGVVSGKALYERRFGVAEAIEVLR